MDEYFQIYDQYVQVSYRLHFFNSCKAKKVIPDGLTIEKNLAKHVNNEEFIEEYEKNLNEASSRGLDLIIERFQSLQITYWEKIKDFCEGVGVIEAQKRAVEKEITFKNETLKKKLANKLETRVQQVAEKKLPLSNIPEDQEKLGGKNIFL